MESRTYVKWTKEISKQVVEGTKWFLFAAYSKMQKERDKLWEGLLVTKTPGPAGFENVGPSRWQTMLKLRNDFQTRSKSSALETRPHAYGLMMKLRMESQNLLFRPQEDQSWCLTVLFGYPKALYKD